MRIVTEEERQKFSLQNAERGLIGAALLHFNGNRTQAAQALGLCRRTLVIKIRNYGLLIKDPGKTT